MHTTITTTQPGTVPEPLPFACHTMAARQTAATELPSSPPTVTPVHGASGASQSGGNPKRRSYGETAAAIRAALAGPALAIHCDAHLARVLNCNRSYVSMLRRKSSFNLRPRIVHGDPYRVYFRRGKRLLMDVSGITGGASHGL